VGWVAAILMAVLRFGAGPLLIGYSQAKAVLLALDVMYVIWSALLLFHIANEAGAIQVISNALLSITADRTIQGLLLGWLFVSFLQGMGGFGVPVAVTAPLLVGVGFNPIQAVIMASIGHGWAVNFGSMATSFQTLMAITGLEGTYLAPDAAILLGLSSLLCGILVALIAGGWKGMIRTLPLILLLGSVMGIVQYLLATNGIWTLGATGGAMAGLAVAVALLRCRARTAKTAKGMNQVRKQTEDQPEEKRSLPVALSGYVILVVLAFAINLIPPIRTFMNQTRLSLSFPALETAFGYKTPAEMGRSIRLFGHPGAILIYSSVLAYLIYRAKGFLKPGVEKLIISKVGNGAVKSSLGIMAMVGMAVVMSHSGMTSLLAEGLSKGFGSTFYPVVAPFIGALGAFITGSNNNSNVLFAVLQQNTAEILGLSIPLILGAQTAGASLGSVFAPAKIIVGCSTVGLASKEGTVMGKTMTYGLITIVFVALVTIFLVWVL
jgi:lactate permease